MMLTLTKILLICGPRGGAVCCGTALQTGRLRVRISVGSLPQSFLQYNGPGVDSVSNRNEYLHVADWLEIL